MCNNTKKRTMTRIAGVDIREYGIEWTVIQPTLTIKSKQLKLELEIPNTINDRPSLEEFKETLEALKVYRKSKESEVIKTITNLNPKVLEYIAYLVRDEMDGVVDLLEADYEYMKLIEEHEFMKNFKFEIREVQYGQHE